MSKCERGGDEPIRSVQTGGQVSGGEDTLGGARNGGINLGTVNTIHQRCFSWTLTLLLLLLLLTLFLFHPVPRLFASIAPRVTLLPLSPLFTDRSLF